MRRVANYCENCDIAPLSETWRDALCGRSRNANDGRGKEPEILHRK